MRPVCESIGKRLALAGGGGKSDSPAGVQLRLSCTSGAAADDPRFPNFGVSHVHRIVEVAKNPHATNGCAANTFNPPGFDPAIGYPLINPHAKNIVAGQGVAANLRRNTFISPEFGTWNMSVSKSLHSTEWTHLQARVDASNVLNHVSYALSNQNVFNTTGPTTVTITQNMRCPLGEFVR
jgi:hypothetical protein